MNIYADEKFREVVWSSTIPVKIDMAGEDVNDVEKPPSLYVRFNNLVQHSAYWLYREYHFRSKNKF